MAEQMSEELQKQIIDFQNMQRQLEIVLMQRQQAALAANELTIALEELGKASGKVYKIAGTIMVEADKAGLEKELKEKKESMDTRLSVLTKQEEKLRAKLRESQSTLQAKLSPKGRSKGEGETAIVT